MEEKMVVDEFLGVQDGEWQPVKGWPQALGAHQVGHLDVVVAVVSNQAGSGKLGHSQEDDKQLEEDHAGQQRAPFDLSGDPPPHLDG